ncbi:MAG: 4-hydroxythreonine-4-phosphate dehydrogenase PdxA [Myxococcales bacterium]|nr:4-hydroxythreonine-4-phosphate dehydrogenase PdxA [Myxococcales bacterium]
MAPIVITQGDPDGVGPELLLRVAAADRLRPGDRVLACPARLEATAAGLDVPWARRGLAQILPLLAPESRPGLGQYAALVAGTDLVLATPGTHLVTAPIDKARAQDEGLRYPGHTEYLAARAGVEAYAMCMVGPRLRVALVTIHLPLRAVPDALRSEDIVTKGSLLAAALPGFVGAARRIAVLGLNPHAGEQGRLGDEETRIIAPAIEALRRRHPDVEFVGPLPADTAMPAAAAGTYGAILAMYHDQGLGPFKLLHFSDGINATLGLPFRRASPDHGTARDIAGRGVADATSMLHAVAHARGEDP